MMRKPGMEKLEKLEKLEWWTPSALAGVGRLWLSPPAARRLSPPARRMVLDSEESAITLHPTGIGGNGRDWRTAFTQNP
jgi:hypothetical protein